EGIPPAARTFLGVIFALLVLATVLTVALQRTLSPAMAEELWLRVKAWWWIVGIQVTVTLIQPRLSIVLFAFVSFWALKEYFTALRTRPEDHVALFFAFFLILPLQYLWIWQRWYVMFLIFVPVYAFLSIPFFLLLSRNPRGFTVSASEIHWGLMAFVYGLGHMAYLLNLYNFRNPSAPYNGTTLLMFLLFVVEMSDVFQYVFGKLFGRHKVWPHISPGKTWEGLIGGIATAVALGYLFRFLSPFSPLESVLVSLLVTTVGFIGGGVMSSIKRDLGKKDFGFVLPGHGGIIDRIDALCWAAPVYFHYIAYFHGHYLLLTGTRS
ncbi:MAG: phosphatidate cytidylyltransferase, partial [Candidatus Hydrothermae bacterium]|nr:phosphatidate cytidylyltransferase [Candidatus Hydrothermae bacterium]